MGILEQMKDTAAAAAIGAASPAAGALGAATYGISELTKQAVDPGKDPAETLSNCSMPGGHRAFCQAALEKT